MQSKGIELLVEVDEVGRLGKLDRVSPVKVISQLADFRWGYRSGSPLERSIGESAAGR